MLKIGRLLLHHPKAQAQSSSDPQYCWRAVGVPGPLPVRISCFFPLFLSKNSSWYQIYFLSFRDLLSKTLIQSALRF